MHDSISQIHEIDSWKTWIVFSDCLNMNALFKLQFEAVLTGCIENDKVGKLYEKNLSIYPELQLDSKPQP